MWKKLVLCSFLAVTLLSVAGCGTLNAIAASAEEEYPDSWLKPDYPDQSRPIVFKEDGYRTWEEVVTDFRNGKSPGGVWNILLSVFMTIFVGPFTPIDTISFPIFFFIDSAAYLFDDNWDFRYVKNFCCTYVRVYYP